VKVSVLTRYIWRKHEEVDPPSPYSQYQNVSAHLKKGTVAVSAGQRVNTGDVLGLCGNSGNSSEAHLHFHVQNSPDLEAGTGMPVAFYDCFVNGVKTERAEPVRGDILGDATGSDL